MSVDTTVGPDGDEGAVLQLVGEAVAGSLLARVRAIAEELAGSNVEKLVGDRLEMGRRQYGPLDVRDGRDWHREALEELLDAVVYLAAETLRGDGR